MPHVNTPPWHFGDKLQSLFHDFQIFPLARPSSINQKIDPLTNNEPISLLLMVELLE